LLIDQGGKSPSGSGKVWQQHQTSNIKNQASVNNFFTNRVFFNIPREQLNH
jgi:hypothetical protein